MGRPYIRFLKKRLAEEFTIGWDNIFLEFCPTTGCSKNGDAGPPH